jgi:hypothetical protein
LPNAENQFKFRHKQAVRLLSMCSSVSDLHGDRFDPTSHRYPMGVFYAPSIKMLSWLQERPIEVRFAPMLSCLSVGRPSGIDIVPVPAKDVYDGEIRYCSDCKNIT